MTAKEKVTKARAGLVLDRPFFGSLSLRLKLIEDPTHETAWTDGKSIGYSPDYINNLTLGQVKGLIAHEVMHLALGHQFREGGRDHNRFNIACDYAIDPMLIDDKMDVPDALVNRAWKDLSAEAIYTHIPEQKDNQKGGPPPPSGCGEVRQATNDNGSKLDEAQKQQQEQNFKAAVVQAAQAEKALLKKDEELSAHIQRLLDEILEPKADWKTILQVFVQQTAKNDYSWSVPNRRYQHLGFTLPTLIGEELPPVVIAVDTSGSISKKDVNQFAAEISDILEEYKTKCTVIYCDTQIAHVEHFESDDLPLELNPRGGGGTSILPVFSHIEENDMELSCLIYLTDMCFYNYPEEPEYPVLWGVIGNNNVNPPFGEIINL